MSRLIMHQDGEWIRLTGTTNRAFIEFLKYSVKPTTYRRYDATAKEWLVYWKQLRPVAHAAKRFFGHIDWSSLPGDWQLYLAGAEIPSPPVAVLASSPYAALFVTEDAPLEVIRAAYKALAVIFHPDHGGTAQQMVELNNAYTEIRNLREH